MDAIIVILLAIILFETTFLTLKTTSTKRNPAKRKIYVDTSALIDGRILKIAQSGFLSDQLIIPRSVIRELQLLADGKDHEKRQLARVGLQNVSDLERVEFCDVEILQDPLDHTLVDERLLALAKENHGIIVTTDYNLCQVAATEHISTLNPNVLTTALDTDFPEGTVFNLRITDTGSKAGQGVGHLENGTMVVVSHADKLIGQTVRVVTIRTNIAETGRIIFADLERAKKPAKSRQKSRNPNKTKALKPTK